MGASYNRAHSPGRKSSIIETKETEEEPEPELPGGIPEEILLSSLRHRYPVAAGMSAIKIQDLTTLEVVQSLSSLMGLSESGLAISGELLRGAPLFPSEV